MASTEIVEMQKALIGVADVQAEVLQQIVNRMEEMMKQMYSETRERQKKVEKTAQLNMATSENPMMTPSQATVDAFNRIQQDAVTQNKNIENNIEKIRTRLNFLGENENNELSVDDLKRTSEAIDENLREVEQQNANLKKTHQEFVKEFSKASFVAGQVPEDYKNDDLGKMVENLDSQIQSLNTTNAQLKQNLLSKVQETPAQEPPAETPRKTL